MKKWACVGDLLTDIQKTKSELEEGKISVESAQAQARLYKAASRMLSLRLEHSRLTARLVSQDPILPDVTFPEK